MMNPKKATSMTAIVLILVGILSYFAKSSPTALIPVFFGVLMGICYMLYDKNNKLNPKKKFPITLSSPVKLASLPGIIEF